MCLESVHWIWSTYHRKYPIEQMDGFKILDRHWKTDELQSPLHSNCKWVVGERKQTENGHGFYFFTSVKEARKYGGNHCKVYPVRAYGVFRKGTQQDALVYMAKEMELLPDPVPPSQGEKVKAINEAIEHLNSL